MTSWQHSRYPARTVPGGLQLIGLCGPLLMVACGCRGEPEAVVITGTVTYRDQPLKKGQIRFLPEDASFTPISGARIIEGKYKVVAKGGVPFGTHRVSIVAHRPTADYLRRHGPPTADTIMGKVPKEQYVPAKYNTSTELQITVEPGSKEIVKNFELTD